MNDTNPAPGTVRPLLFMLSGLIVWFAHFSLIYAFTALACARGFAQVRVLGMGVVPLAIALATVLAVIVLAAIPWRAYRAGVRNGSAGELSLFLRYGATGLALLALVAVLWEGMAALFVPPCA